MGKAQGNGRNISVCEAESGDGIGKLPMLLSLLSHWTFNSKPYASGADHGQTLSPRPNISLPVLGHHTMYFVSGSALFKEFPGVPLLS